MLDDAVAGALAAAGDPPEQAALAALGPALARLALQALADAAAGGRAPALGHRAAELLALGARGGTAELEVGGGLRAVAEYGRLRFEPAAARPPAQAPAPAPAPAALPVPGRARFAGGELTSERGAGLPAGDGTLDAAALAGRPLEVRAWRAGDRMRPRGLGGSRSLQDLFTDRKVPRRRRAAWPVVTCGGEIAWVPGVATGERFAPAADGGERVRLRWVEIA